MTQEQVPELEFVPVEEPAAKPPAPATDAGPPKPPKRPSKPKRGADLPPPSPPSPEPPHAVRASAQLNAGMLYRDRRGRVVGERFAVACPGEPELIAAVVALSHLLPLSGVRWWTAESWHLLEASGEGLAREMLSARLDAALDAFHLAALRRGAAQDVGLYVGGRGLFVPYTGQAVGWDVGGELAADDAGAPRLLDPARDAPGAWSERPATDLLLRIAPHRRRRETSEVSWLLASGRIFPALLSWVLEAGLELSFALVRNDDGADSVLIHVEGLRASDRRLFAGLPEVALLWDPLAGGDGSPAPAQGIPPVLVDHWHELPVNLAAAAFLIDAGRPVIFRAGGPPLVLDGHVPLAPATILVRPELAPKPRRLRPSNTQIEPLKLPLRLVRSAADAADRRTRALLLTPGDLEHLAQLRDHLPWAVTSQAQMAQFDDVAFVLLSDEASWQLPIGLPYCGDGAEGVYLVRGWTPSPAVPAQVLRRALDVADGEVVFLSPARLWCVPREAFLPLAERIELRRDLSRVHLTVEAARFATRPRFPELQWPAEPEAGEPEKVEQDRVIAPPATRSRLLEEARDAVARGEPEKAAVLFERAGEFVEAAQIYDRMLGETAAP
jgi:hypothetical protein